MLLWEMLTIPRDGTPKDHTANAEATFCPRRLPYDKRCATVTKSGKRCRGRIRNGGEYCPLHDPAVAERRRGLGGPRKSPARRRLMHLPDGYLRKLTNRAAVGTAMDRLYRELRLGIVSPEMGTVLFNILNRLLDSGIIDSGKIAKLTSKRSKVDRVRPKLAELLTPTERRAWRRSVANAPVAVLRSHESTRQVAAPTTARINDPQLAERIEPQPLTLQAAS